MGTFRYKNKCHNLQSVDILHNTLAGEKVILLLNYSIKRVND